MDSATHIAAVSIPAFSHQASIVELCKKLLLLHLHPNNLHVTIIFPTIHSPPPHEAAIANLLRAFPSSIDFVFLPPPNLQDLPSETLAGVQIQISVPRSMPFLREKLMSLSLTSRLVCLIADSFATEALAIGKELNLLCYVYEPSTVMVVSLSFHLPEIEESSSSSATDECRDLSEVIQLPGTRSEPRAPPTAWGLAVIFPPVGCVPFLAKDLPDHLPVQSTEAYKLFLQQCKRHRLADGVLVNSFIEMEAGAIAALTGGGRRNHPPIHPVGPIVQTCSNHQTDHGTSSSKILRWLDEQPRRSVLYVSLGSGGTLCEDQLHELALGLKMSGHKFLWALIKPPSKSPSATFIINGTASKDDPLGFLRRGFLERTNGQGLLVPKWVPQVQVLRHGAGFLSHCGWNSTLESVDHGVPMIAWLFFHDQKMNAVVLNNDLKVALRPEVGENGIVQKEEIAKVIKSVMGGDDEGRKISTRIKELQRVANNALRECGSSMKTLSHLALK
ncbi:hydroquinone glucosyltransferase-like [Prosopis cineraria]|uniref:hydroquinone glucosyltransferase-like n=1 Tax=Prosopis cineraria TaxID=364024 RepID=UPI00241008F6|nr:hydroquinone glucosyltransferase-like [Prosopis cineraria]